jgi:hypothetical protein
VAEPNCDALAVLVVRLESSTPPSKDLRWHPWEHAAGAGTDSLPVEINNNSTSESPFKRVPRDGGWSYFNDHVEQVLFPRENAKGGRWLCCPSEMHLEFVVRNGRPTRIARVDLLERLTSPLEIGCTFGLIHLSLQPCREADAPDTLEWARAISSPFRHYRGWSKLDLVRGKERTSLAVPRPIRALAESVFGDPDPNLERSLYSVLMAQCPADCRANSKEEGEWRRALAKRRYKVMPPSDDDLDASEHERRQTDRFAATTSLLLGRNATFTLSEAIDGEYARNLRSYWAESIVFGLLQHDSLEEFQRKLAAIGNPLDPEVQALRHSWLKFRNVLWWSQLAVSSGIPQAMLKRLRNELGTERLFTDLEGDLATYSEQQQAEALANLQIYGAPFVVFAALVTAIGLFDFTDRQLASLIGASLLVAIVASLFVRVKLKGRFKPIDRLKRMKQGFERAWERLDLRGRSTKSSDLRPGASEK